MTHKQLKEVAAGYLNGNQNVFATPSSGKLRSNGDTVAITFNCIENTWIVVMEKNGNVHYCNNIQLHRRSE